MRTSPLAWVAIAGTVCACGGADGHLLLSGSPNGDTGDDAAAAPSPIDATAPPAPFDGGSGAAVDSGGGGSSGGPYDSGVAGPDAGYDAGGPPGSDGGGGAPGPATDAGAGQPPALHPLPPLLVNHGGPVIVNPRIVTVTFAGNANRATYRAFDDSITGSAYWTNAVGEYGIHAGQGGVYAEVPNNVSNLGHAIDGYAGMAGRLRDLVTQGTVPTPDANTVYVLYFPSDAPIVLDGDQSCTMWTSYHYDSKITVDGQVIDAPFTVLPECNGAPATPLAITHALIQAVTDPHPFVTPTPTSPFTWYAYGDAWTLVGGAEAAALCSTETPATVNGQAFARVWSNAAVRAGRDPCQPSASSMPYFAATFATDTVTGITDTWGNGPTYSSDGYLLVPRGTSRDVDVTVFSEAALPKAISVAVLGGRRTSAQSAATVGQGIAVALSQATGTNGAHIKMTFTIDPSAQPGDYPFFTQASVDATMHNFYGILRVQ